MVYWVYRFRGRVHDQMGTMAADEHGAGAGAENSHVKTTTMRQKARTNEKWHELLKPPSLAPETYLFQQGLSFPNSSTNCGPHINDRSQ